MMEGWSLDRRLAIKTANVDPSKSFGCAGDSLLFGCCSSGNSGPTTSGSRHARRNAVVIHGNNITMISLIRVVGRNYLTDNPCTMMMRVPAARRRLLTFGPVQCIQEIFINCRRLVWVTGRRWLSGRCTRNERFL
jgi:hypothetical protein